MIRNICAVGCPTANNLYKFPSKEHDVERRKIWLDYFDMEEPNIQHVFACERHFSHYQATPKGIRRNAVPDVPIIYSTATPPFKRKPKNWRKNVTVVTPRDPEYIIYRNQTGIFTQNVVNTNNNVRLPLLEEKSILQQPCIKSVHCTTSTQTNIRLCGSVQISEYVNEFRLNCFYCYKIFALQEWQKFVDHLKEKHFEAEEAFKNFKYLSEEHDYTPIGLPGRTYSKNHIVTDSNLLTSQIETVVNKRDGTKYLKGPPVIQIESIGTNLEAPHLKTVVGETDSMSLQTLNKPFDISLADKLIKLLDETLLNPIFKNTEKPADTLSQNTQFLNNFRESESSSTPTSSSVDTGAANKQTSNPTAFSRCLKRVNTKTIDSEEEEEEEEYQPFSLESLRQKPTELVFEYTPREIIDLLLDSMKNYPVLWEFHDQPFNNDYNKAINDLCKKINAKWSLNIDSLKMKRSINRILKFYQYMLPCQNIKFENYFKKCALFLPASVDEIPQNRCFYCSRCYNNDYELRQHLIDKHQFLKWPYKCKQCTEHFKESDEYELHKRLPHYKDIFTCELCNKTFSSRHFYKKHLELHGQVQITDSVKYKCNICGKECKYLGELKAHKMYHGKRKYKCTLCPKTFTNNRSLMLHLKRHRKQKDFTCEICGKGFVHQVYLNEHMNKHTGVKVTCNICNLKLRKCCLSRHLRTVHVACEGTIETTFRAKHYNYKRFLSPVLSHKYSKTTKEGSQRLYFCKKCKLHFDRLKFLKDHNKEFHADNEKWPCKICVSVFRRKYNLKRHYKEKHKLHVYQVHKLVDKNEDVNSVLEIKADELDKMSETLFYLPNELNNVMKSPYNIKTTIIKSDPSPDEICFEDEKLQYEIIKAVDNITTEEIKVDDDNSMNDFFC